MPLFEVGLRIPGNQSSGGRPDNLGVGRPHFRGAAGGEAVWAVRRARAAAGTAPSRADGQPDPGQPDAGLHGEGVGEVPLRRVRGGRLRGRPDLPTRVCRGAAGAREQGMQRHGKSGEKYL